MDISSNKTAEHCCICLEENDINSCCFKDKIRHIPCKCNMYCHKYCFNKTIKTHCMVCKQKYLVSWGEDPNNPPEENICKKFQNFLRKKYIGGKISLQKINRRLEKSIRICLTKLSFAHTGDICCDVCMGSCYSLTLIGIMFVMVMTCLMLGGYYLNFWICIFIQNSEYLFDGGCILSPENGLLYILGIIGFPLLLANISCCYICCIPLFINNGSNRRVFPLGIV